MPKARAKNARSAKDKYGVPETGEGHLTPVPILSRIELFSGCVLDRQEVWIVNSGVEFCCILCRCFIG